ncbi:hypothetical protein LJC08_02205 [Methanimicrococcus sp. OttesenSCG-928-J09]|nr:hypothetical protein [Methanimicrococcus sp. OttesenSCG-928-J09]
MHLPNAKLIDTATLLLLLQIATCHCRYRLLPAVAVTDCYLLLPLPVCCLIDAVTATANTPRTRASRTNFKKTIKATKNFADLKKDCNPIKNYCPSHFFSE